MVGQEADPTTLQREPSGRVSSRNCGGSTRMRALWSAFPSRTSGSLLEANSFGTPALLLRAGGFLDSTEEGVSASFVDIPAPEAIAQAVTSFPTEWDKAAIMKHASKFSRGAFAT